MKKQNDGYTVKVMLLTITSNHQVFFSRNDEIFNRRIELLQSDNGWKNNRGIIVTISGKSYGRIDRIL